MSMNTTIFQSAFYRWIQLNGLCAIHTSKIVVHLSFLFQCIHNLFTNKILWYIESACCFSGVRLLFTSYRTEHIPYQKKKQQFISIFFFVCHSNTNNNTIRENVQFMWHFAYLENVQFGDCDGDDDDDDDDHEWWQQQHHQPAAVVVAVALTHKALTRSRTAYTP